MLGNIGAMGLYRIISIIVPFLYIPMIINSYGISDYGHFAFILAVYGVALQAAEFGCTMYMVKRIAIGEFSVKDVFVVYKLKLIVYFLFVLPLMYCALMLMASYEFIEVFFISIAVLISCFNLNWWYQGSEYFYLYSFFNLLERLSFLAFISSVIIAGFDEKYLILLSPFVGQLILLVTQAFHYVKKHDKNRNNNKALTVRVLAKGSWGYFYARLSGVIYGQFGVIYLGALATNDVVGVYSVLEKLYGAIKSGVGVVTTIYYPYLARTKDFIGYGRLVFFLFLGLLLLIGLWFIALMGYFEYYFNIQGLVDDLSYILLGGAMLFAFLSMVVGYPVLGVLGGSDACNKTALSGLVIYVVSCLVMTIIFNVSVNVVIVSILVSEALTFMLRSIHIWKVIERT